MKRPRLSDWFWALAILDVEQHEKASAAEGSCPDEAAASSETLSKGNKWRDNTQT